MKRYQVALLSFALGIFAVTSIGLYLFKKIGDRNVIVQQPPELVEHRTIQVFFSNNIKDREMLDCSKTYPVERAVGRLSDNAKSVLAEYAYLALSKLLEGPAQYEKDNGYFSSINPGTKVQHIIIEGGLATIDFNAALDEGVAGSCRVQAIRSQIEETLKQFPEVKEVIISVNGETEEVLQP